MRIGTRLQLQKSSLLNRNCRNKIGVYQEKGKTEDCQHKIIIGSTENINVGHDYKRSVETTNSQTQK